MSATTIPAADPLLAIGEVSRQTGLAVSAIRYYEECGLVAPVARTGGRRRFSPEAVPRLRVITEVQKAGFSLDEIRVLLGPEGSDPKARAPLVRNKLVEVRRDIRRLQAIERALVAALDCGCDSLEHCRLPSLAGAFTSNSEPPPSGPAPRHPARNGASRHG